MPTRTVMNKKHTAQMLSDTCLALGRILSPQAKVLNVETLPDEDKYVAVVMSSSLDLEVGRGSSEREALYHLMTRLCQRVLKL